MKAGDLWGHSFRAFGFPSGYDDGVWASGVLRGQTAAGWVQIGDVKEPGYRVQPRLSGTTVWDLATGRELATVALEGMLGCINIAPDGVTILAGDRAGNVYCLQYMERNKLTIILSSLFLLNGE